VILVSMPYTFRNFTVSRVAGADPGGAMAWLERRRAWEDRLSELERGRGARKDDRGGSGTTALVAVRDRAEA
jgi:hypothetical protein